VFVVVLKKVEKLSYFPAGGKPSEHGTNCFALRGDKSQVEAVRSLVSGALPFKRINVDQVVRDSPPPRVTRKSEGGRSVAAFHRRASWKNADESVGCSGEGTRYPAAERSTPQPWKHPKPPSPPGRVRKRLEQNNQRAGDPAIEITKNLPDEAESHVGEETMTDPRIMQQILLSFGLKTSTKGAAPWGEAPTRS
jgi:hypothetical protein